MLYYKDDIALTYCKFCGIIRFKLKKRGSGKYKDVSEKRMYYLLLILRLKRLYALKS